MMLRLKNLGLVVVMLAAFVGSVRAEIKMPALFTDHMVLQQQTEVAVWGWADAKAEVTVKPSWSDERYSTKEIGRASCRERVYSNV